MEVRTEEERTPNHDGGKHTEPNETTPLTEPEYVVPPQQRPTPSPLPTLPVRLTHSSWPSRDSWLRNAGPHSLPGEKAFLVLLGWLWEPLKGSLHKWDPLTLFPSHTNTPWK